MKARNQIFLYGIGDAGTQFRVLNYEYIESEKFSVWLMFRVIDSMILRTPGIIEIYMLDNRPGLRADFMESVKSNTVESCQIFKDILRREGLKVYSRK